MKKFILFLLLSLGLIISAAGKKSSGVHYDTPLKIKVGFFNFPGFNERNESGERSGYGYEYLQRLAMYSNLVYEYVGYDRSWEDMLSMLENGEIDILCLSTKTPERVQNFEFSALPVGWSHTSFSVKLGNTKLSARDYKNWNGIRVGMMKASIRNESFEKFAKEKGFSFEPKYFSDAKSLSDALQNGDVEGIVSGNFRKGKNEWVFEEFDSKPFFIMARKNNKELIHRINVAQTELYRQNSGICWELMLKNYTNSASHENPYNKSEESFINVSREKNKVFYAAINPDRFPLSYYSKGEFHGIIKEIADIIISQTGLNIKFLETKTYHQYQEVLSSGKADIIFDARFDYCDGEDKQLFLTQPYINFTISRLRLIQNNNEPKSIGVARQSLIFQSMVDDCGYDAKKFVQFDSIKDIITAVRNNDIDAGCIYTRTAEYMSNAGEMRGMTSELLSGASTSFSVAIPRKSDSRLATILQKTVSGLPKDRIEKILSNYNMHSGEVSLYLWILRNPFKACFILIAVLFVVILALGNSLISTRRMIRQAEIIKKLPLQFLIFDSDFNILLSSNRKDCIIKNNKSKANISDLLDANVAEKIKETLPKVFAEGNELTINYNFNGLGRTAHALLLPESIFERQAVIWITQDTNDLQVMRKKADSLAERLRLTLKSIGDGVIVTDAEGNINLINSVAETLTGYDFKEAEFKSVDTIFKIVQTGTSIPMRSPASDSLKSGLSETPAIPVELVSKNGNRYNIDVSASPISVSDGSIIGSILVFRDNTQDYKNKIKLKEALASANIFNNKLQDIVAQNDIIFNNMPACIYAADIDDELRYTFCNKHFESLLGMNAADIIGKNDREIFGENEMIKVIDEAAKEVIKSGVAKDAVFPFRLNNGELRIGRFIWKKISLSGNRNWIFAMMVDITELENAKHKAIEASEWFRLTLNSIGDGVITTDAEGKIVQINPVAERMTGYKSKDVVGLPHENIFNIVSAFENQPMPSPVRRSLRTGNIVELANHTDLIAKDGVTRYHIADSSAPILDSSNNTIGAILVFRDVSEEYANRDKLRAALSGLEYASELSHAAYFRISLKDRRLYSYSKQFPELWPIRDGKAISPNEYVYVEDLPNFIAATDDIIFGRVQVNTWNFRAYSGGKLRPFRMKASIDNSDSNALALNGVIQDMSE